jgi:septal ring factor EnvC (AmiA/AmiB activator)
MRRSRFECCQPFYNQNFFGSFFQKRTSFLLLLALTAAAPTAAVLSQRRVEDAARLRVLESKIDDTGHALAAAIDAQHEAMADIARRTRDLNALLPLALRLSLYPSETILAAHLPADQALAGLLVAHGLGTELARQVAELRRRRDDAAALVQTIARTRKALVTERAAQQVQAAALERQLRDAKGLMQADPSASGAAALAASLLAAKAADLRGAVAAMTKAQLQAAAWAAQDAARADREKQVAGQKSAPARPAGAGLAGAPLVTPVAGRIVRAWGAPAEDGPATGITYSTAPAAFVSSPCTGRVGFAAPFRSYGRLIIVECGGGYDFVLAGMDRLDAAVGAQVRAGEPVGRMADFDPAQSADRPGLYVELRRGGAAVDPMPYFKGKG